MAKTDFGEYGAFTSGNSIRFTKGKKMVKREDVPTDIADLLTKRLTVDETPKAKFPRPSEEELAKMRAKSLEVKPELQASNEKLAEDAAALSADDFDDEPAPDSNGNEPLPRADEPTEPAPVAAALVNPPETGSELLEQLSIHTAPLEDIARALYERFGIYTVYLRQLPNTDEINPLTAEPFSKYHQGIAYQAAISAQNRGILDRTPEEGRRLIDEGRFASENLPLDTPARTMAEARQQDSFEYRTSVRATNSEPATEIIHVKGEDGLFHAVQREIPAGETGEFNGAKARYNQEEDELILEPQIGKQVIRPNW